MTGVSRRVGLATLACAAFALLGAVRNGGISSAEPGIWDVSLSATGAHPQRVCVADPAFLAQWESRSASCTREKIAEHANLVTFQYRCAGGDFGRSDVTLLTPRSLRIATQGISGGLPFGYQLYARHVGSCAHR